MAEVREARPAPGKMPTLARSAERLRQPLRATLFTMFVVGLVALAMVGIRSWWFIGALLSIVVAATTFAHVIFPGTRFFVVAFANSLAAYECMFIVFVEANFGGVDTPVLVIGFALPIVAFCLAARLQRQRVRAVIKSENVRAELHVANAFTWLLPILVIGALTFELPRLGLERPALNAAFLAAMAAIAAIVLFVGPTIAAFLVDTGQLFEAFFEQMNRALVGAFAFLTFYSVLVIVFAALYRILGLTSIGPDFVVAGHPREMSFFESLYFSVITMATVGYGDITPLSAPARLIAAVQVVVGILLLLFGFSEILTFTRDRSRSWPHRPERPPPDAGS